MIPAEYHDLRKVLRKHNSRSVSQVRVGVPPDSPLGELCINHRFTAVMPDRPGKRTRSTIIVQPNLLIFPEDDIVARIALHDHQHARQLHRYFVMGCALVNTLEIGLRPMLYEADALAYQIGRSKRSAYREIIAYDEAVIEAQHLLEMLGEYIPPRAQEANAVDDARRRLESALR